MEISIAKPSERFGGGHPTVQPEQKKAEIEEKIKELTGEKIIKRKKKLHLKKLKLKSKRKEALQAEIGRRRLLQEALRKKKKVNVLARVEDKIPDTFTTPQPKKEKPTFFSKGGLL